MSFSIIQGDCLEVLKTLPDNSVDAIVTDPPAGIEFMGKEWDSPWKEGFTSHGFSDGADRVPAPTQRLSTRNPMCKQCHKHIRGAEGCRCETPEPDEDPAFVHRSRRRQRDSFVAWLTAVMEEAMRVLKPGGHALVWALPRTSHWTGWALEDAGFEVRDRVSHLFGSGFPKSHNVSLGIDKMQGHADRGHAIATASRCRPNGDILPNGDNLEPYQGKTEEAKQWEGWGTALKPAMEDWWLCRKPLSENNVAANVLKWGVGALNIDGCRVPTSDSEPDSGAMYYKNRGLPMPENRQNYFNGEDRTVQCSPIDGGRWPAHLTHDGSPEVLEGFPETAGGTWNTTDGARHFNNNGDPTGYQTSRVDKTKGSAARFFYCAKASREDRNEGLEDTGPQFKHGKNMLRQVENLNDSKTSKGNTHPTVKATELMRWLCRLITPPGVMVLDMICGTGSTGKAAILEGFNFTGIDQDAEYCRMARARCGIVRPEPKQASFAIPTLNVAPVPAETGPKQATFGDL